MHGRTLRRIVETLAVAVFSAAVLVRSRPVPDTGTVEGMTDEPRRIEPGASYHRRPATHIDRASPGSFPTPIVFKRDGYGIPDLPDRPRSRLEVSRRDDSQPTSSDARSVPSLEEFRRSVTGGSPERLAGIWVEDALAFRVQSGLTSHAPDAKDTLSIYEWAWEHGVVGLLIHNYLGGTKL